VVFGDRWEGGEEMNRKVLALALVIMCLAMLAAPWVKAAEACVWRHKPTIIPYSTTYVVTIIHPPTSTEIQGDYKITKGVVAQGSYNGPLGTGTMTAEMTEMVVNTVTGKAWSYYKNTLVITSGPYGSGTLEGSSWFKFDDVTKMPLTSTSGGTVLHGIGDLKGVTLYAEKGGSGIPPTTSVYEKGWLVIS
jgi:hypothetical protein